MRKILLPLLVAIMIIPCVFMLTACSGMGLTAVETINGRDGKNGDTPFIGTNGNWWIGNEDTGVQAIGINGSNGLTPYIGQNWNWWIGTTDTGKCAIGKDGQIPHIFNGNWWVGETDTGFPAIGQNGQNGLNGITPRIGANGTWWLGELDTGWTALGEAGHTPYIIDGYWWVNGHTTNIRAVGTDGLTPFIRDGNWWIGSYDTGVSADVNVLLTQYTALLDYLAEMNRTIEYLQSLFTPAPASFAVDSWQTIANVASCGLAQNFYNVGDEKTFMLQDGEIITVVILGFNHDDLSNGYGKAGISLGMKGLLNESWVMNPTNTNVGGWANCTLRTNIMPTLFDRLPLALQSIIKTVDKRYIVGGASTNTAIVADKLWLPSLVEINGTSDAGYVDEGTQYAYWALHTTNAERMKTNPNRDLGHSGWRLRSASVSLAQNFAVVLPNGNFQMGGNASTDVIGISFGFCI